MSLLLGAKSNAFSMQKHSNYIVMAQRLCWSLIVGRFLQYRNWMARTLNKGAIGKQRKKTLQLKSRKVFHLLVP